MSTFSLKQNLMIESDYYHFSDNDSYIKSEVDQLDIESLNHYVLDQSQNIETVDHLQTIHANVALIPINHQQLPAIAPPAVGNSILSYHYSDNESLNNDEVNQFDNESLNNEEVDYHQIIEADVGNQMIEAPTINNQHQLLNEEPNWYILFKYSSE